MGLRVQWGMGVREGEGDEGGHILGNGGNKKMS